jgi:hypothetical protein
MDRRIVGFHADAEGDWVAELECGHGQHVRHEPPWQVRPWILSDESRQAHVGTLLNCRLCDTAAYHDARICGLCEDGADEIISRPQDQEE